MTDGSANIHVRCPGLEMNVPEPYLENYPTRLHLQFELQWEMPTSKYARSIQCVQAVALQDGIAAPCAACAKMQSDSRLLMVVCRANDEQLHLSTIKDLFLTFSQSKARHDVHRSKRQLIRIKLWKEGSKVATLLSIVDDHKRYSLLLSENKVARLRQLLSQKVSAKASIKSILAVTKKAIDGEYAPKGYDKRDIDRSELALILGGARMMYAYNQEDGAASHETIRRVGKAPTIHHFSARPRPC